MNVHVLQHVPFEDIGSMEPWLRERGATIRYTRFFESADLPDLSELDLVIAMGGPMSVNDEAALPWLVAEKRFLRDAIQRDIPVLGICLGAQLIASALGSPVYQGSRREIGWHDIEAVESGIRSFAFSPRAKVFHWHGETFDLPSGAVHLARSAACENQAFQINYHVIGLQFHLETTPESARLLVDHCRNELTEGEFIQTEDEILNPADGSFGRINGLMGQVLDFLTRRPA